ncbi:XrtA/PEP-CTERM system histidine kinase PrsK [Duganella sp. FT27W]|uniref:XrtA/PEP-CTERM system histidine kinase PrsK n=1 Tax=Duganella sp. FT27W TaxID=2654636 RepID=UPI00128B8E4E|nr:XrtA/PEP-CTERM system histidine kinase PrsK [Duganella sp. FT27W]MPQ56054.1 PEP-CTERM system histidine kinase PrsK [Duganella sp. FT27W]
MPLWFDGWQLHAAWWLQPLAVSIASYGLAAGAFLLLFMSAARRRRAPLAFHIALAALLSFFWAGMAAFSGATDLRQVWLIDGPEVLRTAAWLLALTAMGGAGAHRRRWSVAVGVAAALQLSALALPWVGAVHLTMMRLALAVTGMLLVEQVYRAAPPGARWGIKLACLGIGALFAYDVYLYADALLFQRVSIDIWGARGVVNALCVPLLIAALRRNPAWGHNFQFSRQIMFRSVALLGAAGYLLAMAASAWYLRLVGGAWGPVMQLGCLCGAVLLLAAVLFSGAVRARLKVLIGKHFYRARYDYREEWQRFTHGLGAAGGPLPERIIEALAGLVESPAGVLWLRHGDSAFKPAAAWNLPLPRVTESALAAGSGLCQLLEARQWVVEPAAWRRQSSLYGDLPVPAWLEAAGPAVWLMAPLLLDRRLFGFVCLAPPRAPVAVNWEVRDVLRIAGRQAAAVLAHRQYANDLAVARQFESFNRMTAFVAHDLKNLVTQLGLLLSNAERHRDNPQFQDAILDTSRHALGKMQHLLRKLHQAPDADAAEPAVLVDLGAALTRAVQACAGLAPQPVLVVPSAPLLVAAQPERLERVFAHLILNAVEATDADGRVIVRLEHRGESALIEVADTGQGMSADFVSDRLFQPFDSTKPAGMGIGVFEAREYLQELGGAIDVVSMPGVGTRFCITLDVVHQEKHDG